MIFSARAPSNIALIKYMGKSDSADNLPANPSLSMTLDGLHTVAEVTRTAGVREGVSWTPELPHGLDARRGYVVPTLGEKGVARIARHADRVRFAAGELLPHYGLRLVEDLETRHSFSLRSANTFPSSSGIASSASSFAAITLASAMACAAEPEAFQRAWSGEPGLRRALARLSRKGSGSSCRSFEGPWVLWEDDGAAALPASMPEMAHLVVLVSSEPKEVSSSEAHERIRSSPLWHGRVERVGKRIQALRSALENAHIPEVARIAWTEAWEMHSLFHTCAEPFTYWDPGTLEVLRWVAPQVMGEDPPIVTLDAGPNVHFIVERSRADAWKERLERNFPGRVILRDRQGAGAVPLAARSRG